MEAFVIFILTIFAGFSAAAFRRPRGVYLRTVVFGFVAAAGALVLALLAAVVLGPNSGFGLVILLFGFWFFVIVAGAAALAGATCRHLLDAARR